MAMKKSTAAGRVTLGTVKSKCKGTATTTVTVSDVHCDGNRLVGTVNIHIECSDGTHEDQESTVDMGECPKK